MFNNVWWRFDLGKTCDLFSISAVSQAYSNMGITRRCISFTLLALVLEELKCLVQSLRERPVLSHHLRGLLQGTSVFSCNGTQLLLFLLDLSLNVIYDVCHQSGYLSTEIYPYLVEVLSRG